MGEDTADPRAPTPVRPAGCAAGGPVLEVLAPGVFATVQDLGRTGQAHLGVPGSGAADRPSFRLANRLVGNLESAAALEITLGGAVLRCLRPTLLALTGAPAPAWLDGRPAPLGQAFRAREGQLLRLGTPGYGLRSYLAPLGGIDVAPVLGSRGTDTLSGLGPAPLRAGDLLPAGDAVHRPWRWPVAEAVPLASPGPGRTEVHYLPGPRDDWFDAETLRRFSRADWRVTPDTDRIGARLAGPRLRYRKSGQLASEGMALGSIEVPPSGAPIVLLADHPTTGGYPVLGVLCAADVALLAQARPGSILRFVPWRPPSWPGRLGPG